MKLNTFNLKLTLIFLCILFPINILTTFTKTHSSSLALDKNMNLITEPEPSSPPPSGEEPSEGADAPLDPKTEGPTALKFLFMYRYPLVQNDKNHKLNSFSYKNVLFAEDQIVFFESTNEADPVKNYFIFIFIFNSIEIF